MGFDCENNAPAWFFAPSILRVKQVKAPGAKTRSLHRALRHILTPSMNLSPQRASDPFCNCSCEPLQSVQFSEEPCSDPPDPWVGCRFTLVSKNLCNSAACQNPSRRSPVSKNQSVLLGTRGAFMRTALIPKNRYSDLRLPNRGRSRKGKSRPFGKFLGISYWFH